jgi:hypothetical protein
MIDSDTTAPPIEDVDRYEQWCLKQARTLTASNPEVTVRFGPELRKGPRPLHFSLNGYHHEMVDSTLMVAGPVQLVAHVVNRLNRRQERHRGGAPDE